MNAEVNIILDETRALYYRLSKQLDCTFEDPILALKIILAEHEYFRDTAEDQYEYE